MIPGLWFEICFVKLLNCRHFICIYCSALTSLLSLVLCLRSIFISSYITACQCICSLAVAGQPVCRRHMKGYFWYTRRAVLGAGQKYNNIKKVKASRSTRSSSLMYRNWNRLTSRGCLSQRADSITKQACNGHMLHLIIPSFPSLLSSVRRYEAPSHRA